jgi:hypothetical protein
VALKAPLLNSQLSAVEPLNISISAVIEPNVTPDTVMLLLATKSFVAAMPTVGKISNASITRRSFVFLYIGKILNC